MTDDVNARNSVEPVAEMGALTGDVLAAVVRVDLPLDEVFRRSVQWSLPQPIGVTLAPSFGRGLFSNR